MAVSIGYTPRSECVNILCKSPADAIASIEVGTHPTVELSLCGSCAKTLEANEDEAWEILRRAYEALGLSETPVAHGVRREISEFLNLGDL